MINYIIELFKKLWFKIVVEVLFLFLMWIIYLIGKKFLPKKYRIKETSFKNFLKSFSVVLTNIAKDDDTLEGVLIKSTNIFEHMKGMEVDGLEGHEEIQKLTNESIELEEFADLSFMELVFPTISKYGKEEIIQKITEIEYISKFTFEFEGLNVDFYVLKLVSFNPSYRKHFACTKGFKYQKLVNLLFQITDNKLYLSVKDSEGLIAQKLQMDFNLENYIVDEKIYNDLLSEINEFKKKNIQRSYILNGPPGTGKTTFCLEISKNISGKLLKIDSTVFNNLASGGIRTLIENFDSDFIIVDDIDRIHQSDLSAFLYMLENIKSFKNRPTLLATVNNIEMLDKAALRPGRFDDIIEFTFPNLEERYNFIKIYTKKLDVEISEEDISLFAEATDGMTQTYLKEYCLQYQKEANMEKLLRKINTRKKYI